MLADNFPNMDERETLTNTFFDGGFLVCLSKSMSDADALLHVFNAPSVVKPNKLAR
jgi:hypothetical protein